VIYWLWQRRRAEAKNNKLRKRKMGLNLNDVLRRKRQQQDAQDRPKAEWFGVGGKHKNPVKVRFLQEFSEDSPSYDSTLGKILFLAEHTSPYDFKRRAECTFDSEGRCFACEMNKIETKGTYNGEEKNYPWSQKTNMYTWVATEDGELKVLSRPAPGTFFDQLHDFSEDDGEGSITKHEFKISKGAAKNDKWSLSVQLKTSFELPDLSEVPDIESAVGRKISYEEQKKFYIPEPKEDQEPQISQAPSAKSESNFDW
jgi:hypothetical protein